MTVVVTFLCYTDPHKTYLEFVLRYHLFEDTAKSHPKTLSLLDCVDEKARVFRKVLNGPQHN